MDDTDKSESIPFPGSDGDIGMIDRAEAPVSNGASGAVATDAVQLSRNLNTAVQGLVRQIHEQEVARQRLEQELRKLQDSARRYDALKESLQQVSALPATAEDLQTLNRVLLALGQDPNHIMVLASVAQQAALLQTTVASFTKLHNTLKHVSGT